MTATMALAPRLMLVLLVPIALCFAAYGYANVRLRRGEMLAEAAREVRDHGTALEVALDAFLRERHLTDMAELTEDLSRADRILGVMIFDAQDRPVLASRSVLELRARFAVLAREARVRRAPHGATRVVGARTLYAYAFPVGADDGAAARGSAVVVRDLAYIDANLQRAAGRVVLVGAMVMLVVALGTWLGVRFAVLRPVEALARGVDRVAAGALDVAVAVPRRDEIGRMAAAFNHMTASLREARAALEAQNEATVALERRLHHAQRLALIGQLAASVAHQVGSPLNVILGRARYALQQGGQSARDARHLQAIAEGAGGIARVIRQLLSHARRGRQPVERVNLAGLVRATVCFLEAECERKGIVVTIEGEDVSVEGARDELEQVVLNLCVNGIQAQPRGGRLALAVRRTATEAGPAAELTVTDAGAGVPEALRARIFEAFFTTKRPAEGTGLGLAICDEIVRQGGGAITVGEAPGGGAVFRVVLPLAERGARHLAEDVA